MKYSLLRKSSAAALMCVLCAVFVPRAAAAETLFDVEGVALDTSGDPIPGATITEGGAGISAVADDRGSFHLLLPAGEHLLRAVRPGYGDVTRRIVVGAGLRRVQLTMTPSSRLEEHVVVQAIRAGADVPVTKKDINREEIERLDYGQEMPFLLQDSPSMTHYADSGTGAGYSYFTLRGIQQTRINMTLDGAPLNDPEESALYFSNFGDFASALGSIQIQRGVGASTVGAASYGGSINFESVTIGDEPALGVEAQSGSFGTTHAAVTAESGQLPGGFALYGRTSFQESDGFKDHSGVRQRTIFFGATRRSDRSLFKLSGFSGRERTELAYLAADKATLDHDLTFNALTPDETDNFGQDFVQAQYTRFLTTSSSLAVQGYYNGAQGTFRVWDDPVAQTALQEIGLDGYFTGAIVTFNHDHGPFSLSAGIHSGWFTRDHFMDIVSGSSVYSNKSNKREASGFAKIGYDLGPWHLYGDAQLRWARFRYQGDIDLGSVSWTFFNPKVGVRRELTPAASLYASVGKATREPTRSDMFGGEDNASIKYNLEAVKPESVVDFEVGTEFRSARIEATADLYAMEFKDEIALTGELSAIGLPIRRNVDRSFRRGVEWDLMTRLSPRLKLRHSGNVSFNRIGGWTQFYDVYDPAGSYAGSASRRFDNVPPLLTPPLIASLSLEWSPVPATDLGLSSRYVARSYLDNTENSGLETPGFFALDASAGIAIDRWARAGRPRLRVRVNNLLDNRSIRASGYAYQYFQQNAGGGQRLQGIPYYYPLATRSIFATLDFRL